MNKIIICFCFLMTLVAFTSCSDAKEEYGYRFEENGFTPKGVYSARIAEKTYSGFKMAVIAKAPEYGKENKYPIAEDTLVLYNSINGQEYKKGYNISFAISKCSLTKEKKLCRRKFLWHANIKEYKEKENQFVSGNTVSIPQVQFIYVQPEGVYKGIVADKKDTSNMGTAQINIRVTENPALAAFNLWPDNDAIITFDEI